MLRTLTLTPVCTLLALAAAAPPPAPPDWMAGCWAGAGAAGSEEQWMKPAGGMMLGMSRTVKGGRVVFHEFMTMEIKADGKLVFTARTGAESKAVPFTAIRYSAEEVVFENPDHDFPQRVIYRRTDSGSGLLGRIEGVEKGKPRAADFPMKRVACVAP